MENATKALIIAGGMLLAMMIVGLLVWGYTNLSETRQAQVDAEELEQLAEFNQRFEAYNKGSVRGYQMISLANLADDFNSKYSEEDGYEKVEIIATMKDGAVLPDATPSQRYANDRSYYDMIKYVKEIYEQHLKNSPDSNKRNQFKELYFECTKVVYDNEYDSMTRKTGTGTGRVKRMEFTQVGVAAST